MSRATTHRSGEVAYDGKMLYTFSANQVVANATTKFGHFVAPCDGTVVQIGGNCIVTPTNATNDLSFGTVADVDSVLDEYDVQNLATGAFDLTGATQGTGGFTITKGEAYCWTWVGADTTGQIVTSVVIEPR